MNEVTRECDCDAELIAATAVSEYRVRLARKYEEYLRAENEDWEADTFQTEWGEGVHNAHVGVYNGVIADLLGLTYAEYREYRETGVESLNAAVRRAEGIDVP